MYWHLEANLVLPKQQTFCLGGGGPILGCTDPNAHNYDAAATEDDGSCETCTDGVINGDETGVDCGGALCNSCPTGEDELLGSFFETGWDGWSDGGSDCYRYSGSRSWEGLYSIRIRDNSGTASAMTSPSLDLTGYSSVDIEFYFYPRSMENGEDFWVRYYNGSSWSTVATYVSGTSFTNNSFYVATVTLNSTTHNFASNSQIRFQNDASGNNDQIYIDAVTVTASTGSLVEGGTVATIEELGPIHAPAGLDVNTDIGMGVKLFPNPANDMININSDQEIESIKLVSLYGQLIKTIDIKDYSEEIDISNLQAGVYYVLIQVNGEIITQKFVKM